MATSILTSARAHNHWVSFFASTIWSFMISPLASPSHCRDIHRHFRKILNSIMYLGNTETAIAWSSLWINILQYYDSAVAFPHIHSLLSITEDSFTPVVNINPEKNMIQKTRYYYNLGVLFLEQIPTTIRIVRNNSVKTRNISEESLAKNKRRKVRIHLFSVSTRRNSFVHIFSTQKHITCYFEVLIQLHLVN